MKKQINIFYSWQSDLDRNTNEKAIRIEIKKNFPIIEDELEDFNLQLEEATRNASGSPDIPMTILSKIDNSDIFICDITTINTECENAKKTPNPNVIFELGYAVSVLGWERVIMLFNENFGNFKLDLPFDLEKRRIIPYNISNKDDNNGKGDLRVKIKNSIELILSNNPKKTNELKNDLKKINTKTKDINNLTLIFSSIHIPTFDSYLNYLPNKIIDKIFFFLYGVQEIVGSALFHIYDKKLETKIINFVELWEKTLRHSNLFRPDGSGNYSLHIPYDVFERKSDEDEFNLLVNESLQLREVFNDLIKFVRTEYLEIDIDELSKIAGDNYNDYHKEKE